MFESKLELRAVNSAVYSELAETLEFTIVISAVSCAIAESPEFTIVNSTESGEFKKMSNSQPAVNSAVYCEFAKIPQFNCEFSCEF